MRKRFGGSYIIRCKSLKVCNLSGGMVIVLMDKQAIFEYSPGSDQHSVCRPSRAYGQAADACLSS